MPNIETKRKLFHLSAILFPLSYHNCNKLYMILAVTIITFLVLTIDICRHHIQLFQDYVEKFFASIMRKKEKHSLSAVSAMMLGMFSTVIFFKKNIVITSWLVLIFADTAASICGRMINKKEGKSIIGALCFFLVAIIASLLYNNLFVYAEDRLNLICILISSLIATIVEFYSNKIKLDDNFSIPVSFSIIAFLIK